MKRHALSQRVIAAAIYLAAIVPSTRSAFIMRRRKGGVDDIAFVPLSLVKPPTPKPPRSSPLPIRNIRALTRVGKQRRG